MTREAIHRIRLLLLVVGALSMGLHYTIVQVVGWVNMTVEYSQKAPLAEALAMTFDGKHPCKLCKLVEKELANTGQEQKRTPDKKLDLKLPPVVCWLNDIRLLRRPYRSLAIVVSNDCGCVRRERPPLPPPREVMIRFS